ncbi:MAG: response regulator [Spirochaetes bacterium]|nr:response regulator [Spirochaetota bacterium]
MVNRNFTTHQVSKICGVTITTIIDWINQDKLKAYRTVGGHRRIKKEDLRFFLDKNNMPFPADWKDSDIIKILIVDDDLRLCRFTHRSLSKYFPKSEIFIANNGFQAGQLMNKINPTYVILDIMLPGINGIEVCKLIKKHNKDTIVIAITGHHSEKVQTRSVSSGVDYYFQKPFDLKELVSIMKQGNKYKYT